MSEEDTKTAKAESTKKDAGDAGDSSSDASVHARELVAFGFEALSPGMRSSSVSRDVIDSGKVVDNVASWLSDGWGPIRRRVEVEIEVGNSSDEDTGVSDSLEDTVATPATETAVEQHVAPVDNAKTTETTAEAVETVETVAATVVEEPVIAHVIEKTVVVATTRIRIKVMMMESNAVDNYADTELTRELLRLWGELSATERTKILAALGLMKRDEVDAELRRMTDEAVGDINVLRGRLRDVEKELAAYQSINARAEDEADENSDSDSEGNNGGDGDGGPQKELSGPEAAETPKTDADGSQESQVQPEAKTQKIAEDSAEKALRRQERRRTEAQANDADESASEESGDSTTGSNSSTGSGGAGVSKTLSPEEQAELMAEMNADDGAGSDVDEIKAAAAAEAASAPNADDKEAEM